MRGQTRRILPWHANNNNHNPPLGVHAPCIGVLGLVGSKRLTFADLKLTPAGLNALPQPPGASAGDPTTSVLRPASCTGTATDLVVVLLLLLVLLLLDIVERRQVRAGRGQEVLLRWHDGGRQRLHLDRAQEGLPTTRPAASPRPPVRDSPAGLARLSSLILFRLLPVGHGWHTSCHSLSLPLGCLVLWIFCADLSSREWP